MPDECFNCVQEATTQYTLVIEPGRILEGKTLCDECAASFKAVDWIEVHDTPVLRRCGDNSSEDLPGE